jgi:hypothetical protein
MERWRATSRVIAQSGAVVPAAGLAPHCAEAQARFVFMGLQTLTMSNSISRFRDAYAPGA